MDLEVIYMKKYKIGEVGKEFGVSIDALRFYEKKGFLKPQKIKIMVLDFIHMRILEYFYPLKISVKWDFMLKKLDLFLMV